MYTSSKYKTCIVVILTVATMSFSLKYIREILKKKKIKNKDPIKFLFPLKFKNNSNFFF